MAVNVSMGNFCLRTTCPSTFSKRISNLDICQSQFDIMELGGNLIDILMHKHFYSLVYCNGNITWTY